MRRFAFLIPMIALAGCSSGNGRVTQPSFNGNAGEAALEAYDGNRDGAIANAELEKAPALKAALAQIDSNGDKRITANEIDARVSVWRESRIGEMPVSVRVTLDGVPLVGAQVVLEPEPFLGGEVPAASGTTAEGGVAGVSMPVDRLADSKYYGVACGFYKIRVTCPTQAILPCYNAETILGCEVAMDAAWVHDSEVKIALKSQRDK